MSSIDKNAVTPAHDFFEKSTAIVTIPSGMNVKIRKINPMTFLSCQTLPTGVFSAANKKGDAKQKGIVKGLTPKQITISRLEAEIESIHKQISASDDVDEMIELNNKYFTILLCFK